MANNNNYKPIPKTIFNEFRLSLKAPIMEKAGGTKEPGLRVSLVKNNPRFDVFTGIPNDKDYGVIKAPMDSLTFFTFLSKMKDIIEGEDDRAFKIVNYTGSPNDKRIISNTYAGKDKNGIIWISLTAEGRPKIKFKILPSNYHNFCDKDGNNLDPRVVSYHAARGWVKQFEQLMPVVMNSYYEEPDYNKNNRYNNQPNNPPTNTPSTPHQGDIGEDDLKF